MPIHLALTAGLGLLSWSVLPPVAEPPDSLLFAVESFTPARGGWALKRSLRLRAEAGKKMRVEYPTSGYTRYPVRIFDQGRRELLLFQVSAAEVPVLTNVDELTLRVGYWKARLTGEQLELLRNMPAV